MKMKKKDFLENVVRLFTPRIDAGWIACACITTHYNRNRSKVDCKCIETNKTV